MTVSQTKKNLSIETLRGVAIILMVLGHVIGSSSNNGLKVADDSVWRWSYYALQYIRMPLFTVISGFVYAYKPATRFNSNSTFLWGKVNRLLIPLVVVSSLFFFLQYITPGTNSKSELSEIWKIYLFPYAVFWFLQGMMIVFIIVTILENFNLLNRLSSALMCFIIAALIFVLLPFKLSFFSLTRVPFLLTFFLFGLLLKRFYDSVFKGAFIGIAAIIFLLAFGYQIFVFNTTVSRQLINLLTLCVGCSACILLIRLGFQNKKLTWLGDFSYAIYLFHIFGAVTGRILVGKLGINNLTVQIIVELAFGVSFPVMLRLLCGSNRTLTVLFFGDKIRATAIAKPVSGLKSPGGLFNKRTISN
ncbi:acyltransferase family protein [Mucilaginibacter celer]|uniref:Acyltransferase n=1 Tax=Mucilaginibacter celer TaxID=2305508 RepID=A0A494VUY4_9SPHI|nr:acyltransferase [Mucilaginibacter celer]AYL95243.1 acyltransferase [Mucilaginibacter celer]